MKGCRRGRIQEMKESHRFTVLNTVGVWGEFGILQESENRYWVVSIKCMRFHFGPHTHCHLGDYLRHGIVVFL